jgi:hypothetical protein
VEGILSSLLSRESMSDAPDVTRYEFDTWRCGFVARLAARENIRDA